MLKTFAFIFAVVFIAVGILGFVPALTPENMLLGLFHVNALHNFVHIATGFVAFLVGNTSDHASKVFFQIFGIVYLLVAILGFFYGERNILGLLANNMADVWLHLGIAAVSLFLGFGVKEKPANV